MAKRGHSVVKRKILLKLAEMQRYRCACCRIQMWLNRYDEPGLPEDQATYEHIIPHSQGGQLSKENGIATCYRCNEVRSTQDILEFAIQVEQYGRDLLYQQMVLRYQLQKQKRRAENSAQRRQVPEVKAKRLHKNQIRKLNKMAHPQYGVLWM